MQALDYFGQPTVAAAYVASRLEDAAFLMIAMVWETGPTAGVLQCKVYGHSVLWDVLGTRLHAFHTDYEVLPSGGGDVELGTLQEVLAFVLARNW